MIIRKTSKRKKSNKNKVKREVLVSDIELDVL